MYTVSAFNYRASANILLALPLLTVDVSPKIILQKSVHDEELRMKASLLSLLTVVILFSWKVAPSSP